MLSKFATTVKKALSLKGRGKNRLGSTPAERLAERSASHSRIMRGREA